MINAAIVGLGWWGKNIVNAVQGKSDRVRFVRGVSIEPEPVRAFAAQHGLDLSTNLADALRIRARSLARPKPARPYSARSRLHSTAPTRSLPSRPASAPACR